MMLSHGYDCLSSFGIGASSVVVRRFLLMHCCARTQLRLQLLNSSCARTQLRLQLLNNSLMH